MEDEVLSIGCTIDRIVNLKHASAKQTTLDYITISLTSNDHYMHKPYFKFVRFTTTLNLLFLVHINCFQHSMS